LFGVGALMSESAGRRNDAAGAVSKQDRKGAHSALC
jgi:hypothetical protein